MSERYRNLFCYYRGPQRGDVKEKAEALENNVTKALLNTLELCPKLGDQFIDWLNKRLPESLDPPNITELRILENPTDEEIEKKSTKIMLGIKKYNGEDYLGEKGKGKVDGTIVGQDWLIAIESKLGGIATRQFQKEKETIGAENKNTLKIYWRDIHDFFFKLDKKQCDPIEKLFIEQFTGYLKAIGQLPFQGFKERHFGFFTKDKSEREKERLELKGLMNALGADLWDYKDNNENVKSLYRGEWDWVRGLNKNNRQDSAELSFYLSSRKQLDNQCYLGIYLTKELNKETNTPEGYLEVYACIDKEELLRRLANKFLKNEDQIDKIFRETERFDDKYRIVIAKNDDYLLDKALKAVTKSCFKKIGEMLKENMTDGGLSFYLAKTFREHEITAFEGDEQVGMIAKPMTHFKPYIEFVNNL